MDDVVPYTLHINIYFPEYKKQAKDYKKQGTKPDVQNQALIILKLKLNEIFSAKIN